MDQPSNAPSPFDFDDAHDDGARSGLTRGKKAFLRWSIIVAAVSFFVALAGAVLGNNVSGDTQLESIAWSLNRFGMLCMLLGCVGIFAVFRFPTMPTLRVGGQGATQSTLMWWRLFFASIVGFFVLVGLTFVSVLLVGPMGFVPFVLLFMVLFPLLVVMSMWHQGMLRAYAIGLLLSFIPFLMTTLSGLTRALMMSSTGRSSNVHIFGGLLEDAAFFTFVGGALISVITALTCAGYVHLLESHRRAQTERNHTDASKPLPESMG